MHVMKTIRPQELNGLPVGLLLDVRTSAEYQEMHIPGSILEPIHSLDPSKIRNLANGQEVYVVCKSGNRARQAVEKLNEHGLVNATVVEGGVTAWESAGLPVQKGLKTISLERQVRIAAGMLVIFGTALGVALHPAFYALAAFVGVGLVFAGITDSCGLGMVLARMPWNNRGSCESGSCSTTPSRA